ncbi:hypothetical protein [Streptomyces sp. NPDC001966]
MRSDSFFMVDSSAGVDEQVWGGDAVEQWCGEAVDELFGSGINPPAATRPAPSTDRLDAARGTVDGPISRSVDARVVVRGDDGCIRAAQRRR